MKSLGRYATLDGSAPTHAPGTGAAIRAPGADQVAVRVVLHPGHLHRNDPLQVKLGLMGRGVPGLPPRLSRAEFARVQAPDPLALRQLLAFADRAGLTVRDISALRHDVTLTGRAETVARAFSVEFEMFDTSLGPRRSHRGDVAVPVELHRDVVGVLGLDLIPRHRPNTVLPAVAGNFPPSTFADYYGFPAARGAGQRVAILSFGGGFHRPDLDLYFRQQQAGRRPVRVVELGGATNHPTGFERLGRFMRALARPGITRNDIARALAPSVFDQAKGTFETTADVQLIGALAPGAEIQVIFASADAPGFYDAIYTAIGLGSRAAPAATVISISWGATEPVWAGHLDAIDQALRAACLMGVTVVASSGDFGAAGTRNGRTAAVNFPASSPHVLAVGGTRFTAPPEPGTAVERVWAERFLGMNGASGGGFSGHFSRPDSQRHLTMPVPSRATHQWLDPDRRPGTGARGVPDVAAAAAHAGGYQVTVGGVPTTAAGTSCATPLWAALIARMNESLRRPLGWITPVLYQPDLRPAFRDITEGDNRLGRSRRLGFRARPGWDPCTGLGTPHGETLLALLRQRAGRRSGKER